MTTKNELSKSGKSTLVRPRFSPGLLLQDDDLTLAVDYVGNLSRLLFKSLFGCGVICGFGVGATTTNCGVKIEVKKGLGLDCCGNPVHLPDDQSWEVSDCATPKLSELWMAIRRKEYQCMPRDAVCAPEEEDQGAQVATRIRDGWELKVFLEWKECGCECKKADSGGVNQGGGASTVGTGSTPGSGGYAGGGSSGTGSTTVPGGAGQGAGTTSSGGGNIPPGTPGTTKATPPPVYSDPANPCYADHYAGKCACDCCCEWILLGRVNKNVQDNTWSTDYSVRRFVRPVLMRDQQTPVSST